MIQEISRTSTVTTSSQQYKKISYKSNRYDNDEFQKKNINKKDVWISISRESCNINPLLEKISDNRNKDKTIKIDNGENLKKVIVGTSHRNFEVNI